MYDFVISSCKILNTLSSFPVSPVKNSYKWLVKNNRQCDTME